MGIGIGGHGAEYEMELFHGKSGTWVGSTNELLLSTARTLHAQQPSSSNANGNDATARTVRGERVMTLQTQAR